MLFLHPKNQYLTQVFLNFKEALEFWDQASRLLNCFGVYSIYHVHKCENANNCWHFNIHWHAKDNLLEFESKKSLYFSVCLLY